MTVHQTCDGGGSHAEIGFGNGPCPLCKAINIAQTALDRLREISGELGAAICQSIPEDDQIIMAHVRDAHNISKTWQSLGAEAVVVGDDLRYRGDAA